MKGNIPEKMRRHNLRLILDILTEKKELSAHQLSRETGLSVVSINKLLSTLKDLKLIKISKQNLKTRGRRANCYELELTKYSILSVRIFERTSCLIAKMEIIDLGGKRLSPGLIEKKINSVGELLAGIQELLSHKKILPAFLVIGLPKISKEKITRQNMDWLNPKFIKAVLTTTFALPCQVVKDANAIAYGAAGRVDFKASAISIYYPLHFCPRAGMVNKGTLINGTHNDAGEFYLSQKTAKVSLADRISKDIITLASLIDPEYVFIFAPNQKIEKTVIEKKIKATDFNFNDYKYFFNDHFDDRYCYGLLRLGQEKIYDHLLTDNLK